MKRELFILSLTIVATVANCFTFEELKNNFIEKVESLDKPKFLEKAFRKFHQEHLESKIDGKILQSKYYPGGQIYTNQPIIGVLTQPYINKAESATTYSTSFDETIIPASHIDFLEAAGARIVPLNYKLRPNSLGKILESINGVYIPGDQDFNLKNEKYMDAVETIMEFALDQEIRTKKHFPVMAISYGYVASLIGLGVKSSYIEKVPSDLINDMETVTFRGNPFNSYMLDGFTLVQAEAKYEDLVFLNEVSQGIYLKNLMKDRKLQNILNPIAVFNQPRKQPDNEIVAIVEGITFPYFGIAFSIDLIQTNIDMALQTRLELSDKASISEAQRIANLFVDEARLNGNRFSRAADEKDALIGNYVENLMLINMSSPSGDFSKFLTMAYVFK